jgi:hypothetical protein
VLRRAAKPKRLAGAQREHGSNREALEIIKRGAEELLVEEELVGKLKTGAA